ncbi:PAS domain-containing protein [Marinobacter nauticus]|uniref:PAS domain-containing protein n=1 Tax=Marinobacter nauticus TaxID=2743 RepID=UPI003519BC10
MDSDLRNTPGTRFRLWPGLWMPGVILGIGILVSVALANTLARTIADLGLEAYHARHQALVATIAARLQKTPGQQLPASLTSALATDLPEGLQLRIDTLARHTKQAVLELGNLDEPRDSEALRTELTLPGRHWMVTTTPSAGWIDRASNQARWQILTAGAGISVLAALLMLVACRRLAIRNARIRQQQAQLDRDQQQITNLQVEKSVLRHALNDSEARSRDLVRLGGAVIAELDHQGRIGFVSAQIADVLGRAPSDLTDQPFEQLVSEQDRSRFRESLDSARSEEDLTRTDLVLIGAEDTRPVRVCLRLKPIKDPVHGITGFRLSANPD